MAEKENLILTPDQILYRVSAAMLVAVMVLGGLFMMSGENAVPQEPDILAVDS